jgi:PP-loop superfamily ATP-utilizing enzyme
LFNEEKLKSFIDKILQTSEEIKELLEVGFEYVCEKTNCYSSGNTSESFKNLIVR